MILYHVSEWLSYYYDRYDQDTLGIFPIVGL